MGAPTTLAFCRTRWSKCWAPDPSSHLSNLLLSFLDAKEDLLKAALIERFDDATLSVHRLVQAAIMNQLSSSDRTHFADYVIKLLIQGFPNTWESDVGHQFSAWKACEMCLPHVKFLVKQIRKWKLHLKDPQAFADLGLRCCW